jgi:hypothetical protein
MNPPNICHLAVADRTVADRDILLPEAEDHPEAVAVGRTDLVVERHTGPGLEEERRNDRPGEAGRTDRPGEVGRTDLEEGRRTGLAEERHIDLEEAAGRNLAVGVRRTGHREHHSRQERGGWSSRPWHRSCGRWRREGA